MIKRFSIIMLLVAIVACPDVAMARKKKDKKQDQKVPVIVENKVEERDLPITDYMVQLNGEWNVVEIKEDPVNLPKGSRAYLNFDVLGGMIYGNTGSNSLNAMFAMNGNKISISNMLTTKKNGGYFQHVERDLLRALDDVNSLALTQVGETEYMEMKNKRRDVIVKLRRQNLDFMNGPWQVYMLNGVNVLDRDLKLVNDVDMFTVNITSGCNIINGVITIDPSREFAIEYEDLKSSHNQCPNIDTETRLLIALEETQYCRKRNQDEVELYTMERNEMGKMEQKTLVILKKVRM